MDLLKAKLPIALVVSALIATAGAGGTVALAKAKQAETADRVEAQAGQIGALEKESQQNRERVLRIEILAEQVNRAVDRIEKKLDRR